MNYKSEYEKWLNNPALNEEGRRELESIAGDEKAIEYRFGAELEFGTAGMRGIIGYGTNMMNVYTVRRATQGLSEYIKSLGAAAMKRGVVISYDTRRKSEEFAKASAGVGQASEPQWRSLPLGERLSAALVKGVGDYLEADIADALAAFPSAVSIIEGPLMDGMNRVGELFGSGKMFLPQVVKAARTMKQAVKLLNPYIEGGRVGASAAAGKVLLATVKGDVHDIGKNIVSVVMACNNYDIVDLGVMVPAGQIVKKAKEERVDLIGLSGLITPSLDEMVNVAKELATAGIDVPLMIGGATTSKLHVALKIAPVYGGPVVWVKDASQNPLVAARLLDAAGRAEFVAGLDAEYEALRADYHECQARVMPLDEARSRKLNLFGE